MSTIQSMTGAEPVFFEGGPAGVLLLHGLTGTPQSLGFLAEFLAREGGVAASAPRLAGHGTTPEDLATTTAEDWVRSAERAMLHLSGRSSPVVVGGLSMGGTLALYLAAMYRAEVAGVFTINAPVFLNLYEFAALAFAPRLPPWIPGFGSDIKRPDMTEVAYPVIPTVSVRHLYALMAVTGELLGRVRCPTLVFQSREDHVVAPENGPHIWEKVAAEDRRLVSLEDSYHVATLDNDRERIAGEALGFIREIARQSAV